MEHDTFLYLIWWLDRRLLTPLTHRRTGPQSWTPRRFTPTWLAAHPWLWCRKCSDGLTTWLEVRRGLCEVCSSDRWLDAALAAADAAGAAGLHDTHHLTTVRRVGSGWANTPPRPRGLRHTATHRRITMSEQVQTNLEIWGRPFPLGGEWDAGHTPSHVPFQEQGRWTARLTAQQWEVVFHRFADGEGMLLASYPPTEAGERQAKAHALRLRDERVQS